MVLQDSNLEFLAAMRTPWAGRLFCGLSRPRGTAECDRRFVGQKRLRCLCLTVLVRLLVLFSLFVHLG